MPDPAIAQALAVPLRRRIFEFVASAGHPVTVAELTESFGCNHNAVRQHLARLREAGLVDEETEERTERGRPRLVYTPAPRPDPYARIAALLTKVVRTRATPRAVGQREGRAAAERSEHDDPIDALEAEAEHGGFAPRRLERRASVEISLNNCPFADVAADDPRTICALHRGLAEGLVAGIGRACIEHFVARDPYEAGCVIRVRRTQ